MVSSVVCVKHVKYQLSKSIIFTCVEPVRAVLHVKYSVCLLSYKTLCFFWYIIDFAWKSDEGPDVALSGLVSRFSPEESISDSYITPPLIHIDRVCAVSCQFTNSTLHLHFYHSLSSVDTRLSPLLSVYLLIFFFFPSPTHAVPPILSLVCVPWGSFFTHFLLPTWYLFAVCKRHLKLGHFGKVPDIIVILNLHVYVLLLAMWRLHEELNSLSTSEHSSASQMTLELKMSLTSLHWLKMKWGNLNH